MSELASYQAFTYLLLHQLSEVANVVSVPFTKDRNDRN
jgi:hypothetical protein